MKKMHTESRNVLDATKWLKSCGMGVTAIAPVSLAETGDARMWRAETTRGPRWIWWATGWRIAKADPRKQAA